MVCRVEKLGLHALAGKLKALGAILCVAGALTTSLYKGKAFHLGHHGLHPTAALETSMPHWGRGTFMLLGSCLSYATWYIVQVCIPLQSIYYILVTENARHITDFLFAYTLYKLTWQLAFYKNEYHINCNIPVRTLSGVQLSMLILKDMYVYIYFCKQVKVLKVFPSKYWA